MNLTEHMSMTLIIDEKDFEFIENTVRNLQFIFHPEISPKGVIDSSLFYSSKAKKPISMIIDRNILSSILRFCEKGYLNSAREAQIIGILMVWAFMHNISITAGLAITEHCSKLNSQLEGLIELRNFSDIFDAYPLQMWLNVAKGQMTKIPPLKYSNNIANNIDADFTDTGDHYTMAFASLLHAVILHKNKALSPLEKTLEFIKWMYDNLLASEYLLVYITMWFTEQKYISIPKHANSNNISKIIAGCENQAWDISYLTNWSVFYSDTEHYTEEFLFATNDILLKRIFINTNTPTRYGGLLKTVFPKKDYDCISAYIFDRMQHRVKPNFGNNPSAYFNRIVDNEKKQLELTLLT